MKKIKLVPICPQTIFFPSVDEVSSFFNFPVSAKSKVRLLETITGISPQISNRSLDNFNHDGISFKLFNRAFKPFLRPLFRRGLVAKLPKTENTVSVLDVYYFWDCAFRGFELGNEKSPVPLNLSLLSFFLHDRNEKYKPILKYILNSPSINEENKTKIVRNFHSKLIPQTLLTEVEQTILLQAIENNLSGRTICNDLEHQCLIDRKSVV